MQAPTEASEPRELESQAASSCLMWGLGTEPESSLRQHTLNHLSNTPLPSVYVCVCVRVSAHMYSSNLNTWLVGVDVQCRLHLHSKFKASLDYTRSISGKTKETPLLEACGRERV